MKKLFKNIAISLLIASQIFIFSSTNQLPQQIAATSPQDLAQHKALIFQGFSMYQPYSENSYSKITPAVAKEYADLGVTDWWYAPPFRNYALSHYNEGYAVSDRYDLGDYAQGRNGSKATKYGTRDELSVSQNYLKQSGIRPMLDIVPLQMIGLQKREAVNVINWKAGGASKVMSLYTTQSGQGQKERGTVLKDFNQNHFVGSASHNQGFRIMSDSTLGYYKYYGPNDTRNKLPAELRALEGFTVNKVSEVLNDGYLPNDVWVCRSNCNNEYQNWIPILAVWNNQTGINYRAAMSAIGINPLTETDKGKLGVKTSEWVNANFNMMKQENPIEVPVWEGGKMSHWLFNGKTSNKAINSDLAVGLGFDYGRTDVMNETKAWVNWLIDNGGFESFRTDGAGNFSPALVKYITDTVYAKKPEALMLAEKWNSQTETSYLSMPDDNALRFNPGDNLGITVSNLNKVPFNVMFHSKSHDGERNIVQDAQVKLYGRDATAAGKYINEAFAAYYQDQYVSPTKQYSANNKQYNSLMEYAIMLTQADVIPNVFYGDIYRSDKEYMSTYTPIGQKIKEMMRYRKSNAFGAEYNTAYGSDVMTSVRRGATKDQGMITLASNNPTINKTVNVKFNTIHAGKRLVDITGTHPEKPVVKADGSVDINVRGQKTGTLYGDVAMFVPENTVTPKPEYVAGIQGTATKMDDPNPENVKFSLEMSQGINIANLKFQLKSKTTGAVVDLIDGTHVWQNPNNLKEIHTWINQSNFKAGETYEILVTADNVQNVIKTTTTSSGIFANGNKYENKNVLGNLEIAVTQGVATPFTISTTQLPDYDENFKVSLVTSTEENLQEVQVLLRSKTSGWEFKLTDGVNMWQNPNNKKEIHVWLNQGVFSRGEEYEYVFVKGGVKYSTNATATKVSGTFADGKIYNSNNTSGKFSLVIT